MINLYRADETNFEHNGLCSLDDVLISKPKITEVNNAEYHLELEIAITDRIKRTGVILANENLVAGSVVAGEVKNNVEVIAKHEMIQPEMIIKANGQLFRIKRPRKQMNKIYIYARHIFYDNADNLLEDVRPTQMNGTAALNWMFSHTQYPHNFTALSDISEVSTAYYVRKNLVESLIGSDDNSFVNRWGGEIVRDNFTVKMLGQRGMDRGVSIEYGKNLLGIEETINMDTVATRIMPVGAEGVMLPEKYVDSQYINNYPTPKIRIYEFSDIKVDEETTAEQAYELLRQKAAELYIKHKVDIPQVNYKVNFQELSKTDQYKNFAVLERVYMGDTVTIKHRKLKINLKAKVIKTILTYDIKAQEWSYSEIELGNYQANNSNMYTMLVGISNDIINSKSDLQKAIERATTLLTTAMGGHVIKREGELLIMDTEDPMTAEKVWRWNLHGLGYSKTGINGPYGLAMTINGEIVADFITAGVLNGEIIKAGVITSKNGKLSINLDDDTMIISGKSKWVSTDGSGSYITIEGKDLIRYDGPSKRKFHDLTYSNKVPPPPTKYYRVDIPSNFVGKDWRAIVSLTSVASLRYLINAQVYIDSSGDDYFIVYTSYNASDGSESDTGTCGFSYLIVA